WWSWFRSSSHWGTRPRLPRPRLCRQPRLSSRIAARVVAWGTCKRSGEPPDPGGKSANAFPFSHLLSRDTIPQVASPTANWLSTGRCKLGRGDRFRPTACYSAAMTAPGVARLTGNRGGIGLSLGRQAIDTGFDEFVNFVKSNVGNQENTTVRAM